jgi:Flp pilus assembly pilin Flp
MARIVASVRVFVQDEEGVSLVEYTLLLVLIVVIAMAGLAAFGSALSTLLSSAASSI